ncbi:MAG: hypothetical protein KAS95_03285 [Candidatus Heimdallarchaeota archaeon]|nr:hypothetical protein [Candidatus Heimdallarchaeota archaeon]
MKFRRDLLTVSIILVVVLSIVPPVQADIKDTAKIEQSEGSVFLKTSNLIVKLASGRPDMLFWFNNATRNNRRIPVFHVGFYAVAELFGDDLIVDSRDEIDGKIYLLNSELIDWTLTTENTTNALHATITSSTLANGATISFAYHLYLEDAIVTRDLNGTTIYYSEQALNEIKFDIIVDNWTFSPEATGLIFLVKAHEMAYKHRVRQGNRINAPEDGYRVNETEVGRTNRTHDADRYGINFSDDNDNIQGYFTWIPEVDIYDAEDNYLKTVNCTATVASYSVEKDIGEGKTFGVDLHNILLVYPNYGDGLKMVHDPLVGLNPESYEVSASWSALLVIPVIGFLILIVRRRKN